MVRKGKTILKLPRKAKTIESDVVVVGGGLSGIATAITCASKGLRTFLIEKYGFLGGLTTNAFAFPLRVFNVQKNFMELFTEGDSDVVKYPIFSTLIRYLLKNKAIPDHPYSDPLQISGTIIPFDFERFKFTMLEVLLDFKVNLLLHALFIKPRLKGDTLTSVFVLGKEGLIEVKSKYFVDATGNCEVFKAIDESLVRRVGSIPRYNFIISGCDFSKVDDRIVCQSVKIDDFSDDRYHAYVVDGDGIKCAIYELLIENHALVFGFGEGEVDPDDVLSISAVEENLQLKVYDFIEYLRQFKPFENIRISMFPAQIYFTESHKIKGLYTLVSEDVFNGKSFNDEIAVLKTSVIAEKMFPCVLAPDRKFDKLNVRIPFSSFLTEIKNLVAVGRNVDVSEELKFILYSFPFVVKTSESIGNLISFAHGNNIGLNKIRDKID
ncbi:MAG: FAD-dependent oxidoreductase [Candidatus Kryptonium sp.]|nr:FAD-dependent oxidoreductase [Candidatus Kryptonium sp.]MDW8109358.1 FAD-dependent oxidoreductase [Candidatus Kryptonium sp.]